MRKKKKPLKRKRIRFAHVITKPWDSYRSYVVGVFSNKAKAEACLAELESEEERDTVYELSSVEME